jgi:predicted Zn-dependent protease
MAAKQVVYEANSAPIEALLRRSLQSPSILGVYRKDARLSQVRCAQFPLLKGKDKQVTDPQAAGELAKIRAASVASLQGLIREEKLSSQEFHMIVELAYAISDYGVAEAALDEWARQMPGDKQQVADRVQHYVFRKRYEEAWETFQQLPADSKERKLVRAVIEKMLMDAQSQGRLANAVLPPETPESSPR